MTLRAPILLAGTLALAGCSSQASAGSPTASATRAPQPATASTQAKPSPTRPSSKPAETAPAPSPATPATKPASGSFYTQGTQLLHSRQYKKAETAFRRAIAAHDHVLPSQEGLGTAAIGLHDYKTALTAFRVDVKAQPANPTYEYDAAFAALYSLDDHAAVSYATVYIRQRPKDYRGYHLRFLAYGSLLDRPNQLKDGEEVVKLRPNDALAHNDLGIALVNDGKNKQGIVEFSKALALQPNNPAYYQNRGVAESQAKEYAAALKDLQHALALTTDAIQQARLKAAIALIRKQMHH